MSDMTEAEKNFRKLAQGLAGYHDTIATPNANGLLRPIVATAYDGAYGRAGWVLAIEGSPPKGTFVVPTSFEAEVAVFYLTIDNRVRKLGERQTAIVLTYVEELGK